MATSNSSGINSTRAQTILNNLIAGGADVRLLTSVPSYTDESTDLSTYEVDTSTSYSAQTVAEADWTVNTGTTFTEAATLTNANSIDFGEADVDWGNVVAVAIDNGTDFFISPDLSADITQGEKVSINSGSITYNLGN